VDCLTYRTVLRMALNVGFGPYKKRS